MANKSLAYTASEIDVGISKTKKITVSQDVDLDLPDQTVLGRVTGGDIGALTLAQLRVLVNGTGAEIYGVSWGGVENPIMTRTDDSIGMVANAGVDGNYVVNNFDNAQIFKEIHDVTDTLGNEFVRIPKFYIKKTANKATTQISKFQHAGFYLPWCFWDFTNSRELSYVDIGKHKATKDGASKLQSIPNVYPLVSTNIVDFRTYAQNNNVGGLSGYQQLDLSVEDVLQTLITVEFATLDSQSIMAGFTTGQYSDTHTATVDENAVNRIVVVNATAALYEVGQTISIGTSLGGNQIFYGRTITSIDDYDASNKAISFDGATVNIAIGNILYNTGWKNGFSSSILASSGSLVSNSTGKYPCMYRGIESPWGDLWQLVDGVNITDNQAWVTPNAEDYASNVFADPYSELGYVNHNANGYPTTMGYDSTYPYAEFPTAVGGDTSTYYSDYYYQAAGARIALFGGNWYDGTLAGLFAWHLDSTSSLTYIRLGARLVKKPL